MPILTLTCVGDAPADAARRLADRLGAHWALPPGRVWVRLWRMAPEEYAQSGVGLATPEWPVFVEVLHRDLPEGAARAAEAMALTQAVAEVLGRPPGRVHVAYAPAGRGRQAFGGTLI